MDNHIIIFDEYLMQDYGLVKRIYKNFSLPMKKNPVINQNY